ncbi:MAG: PBP1A family penicillin-binding protein [Deltaproteobacteria bacterium]|nr:PBP1A family penicillin-binding protein [Deltaproteobacteria bacterium]
MKLRLSYKIIGFGAIALIALVFGGYFYFTWGLPSLEKIEDYHPQRVTKAFSRDGRLIGEFYTERRIVVGLERVPKHLIHAFLAAEDSHFYEHEGISYLAIFRAMYKNVLAGKVVQGGSTITQQVAKSFFLTPERKISRKIREAIMAYRIEKHLTKDEILHLYLNQIYLGNGVYGVQTASDAYFGKGVERLTLAEAAILASLPKAPSKYSPFVNPALAKKRQEYVLSRMVEEGYIKQAEADKAVAEKFKLNTERKTDALWVGPYFTEHVRRYIEEKYGEDTLYKGGLTVHTTLDVDAQKAANAATSAGLREYDKRHGFRGAQRALKTPEETALFKAEMDKRLAALPMAEGDLFQAVVVSFNQKDSSLLVEAGSRKGVISKNDMDWARLYNPEAKPDAGKYVELKKLFKQGDILEVRLKAAPANAPLQLQLEQEPLAQAALIAMDPETGHVRAMTGGLDFSKSQFNRAVQAFRQPGSAFKPVIYTTAIDAGYTPASIIMDSPLVFEQTKDAADNGKEPEKDQWRPKNYDEHFAGPTTFREALAKSRNVVTIKILKDIGVGRVIEHARLLGINSPLAPDLSLALGSSVVTPLEMTTAFSTLANLGSRAAPVFITKITDASGNILEENGSVFTPAISPQTAYVMTNLLQGVIENGTGARAKALGRPAAGKTGTTNDLNDAWFVGYVPGLAATAWVGYDDQRMLGGHETGAVAALPIWLKFMKEALADQPVRNFQAPDGVEFVKIDAVTGLSPSGTTQNAIFEVFKTGTGPRSATTDKSGAKDFSMMDTDSKTPLEKVAEPPQETSR